MFFDATTDEVVLRIVYEGGQAEPRAMLTEVSRALWLDRGEVSIDATERLAHIEHTGGVVSGICLRNQLVACSAESLGDEAFGDLIEHADALVVVGPWDDAAKRGERLQRLARVLKKHRPRGSVVMPTTAETMDLVSTLALAAGDAWHGGNANDVKRASVEALRTTVRRLAGDLQPERLGALPHFARAPLPQLAPLESKKPESKKPESKKPESKPPEASKAEPKQLDQRRQPNKPQPPRILSKKRAQSNTTTTGPLPPPPVPGYARSTPRPRSAKPRPPKIRRAPPPRTQETVSRSGPKPPVPPCATDTSYNFSARAPRDKRTEPPKADLAALFHNELPREPDDSGSEPILAAMAPVAEPEPTPELGAPATVQGDVTPRLAHEIVGESTIPRLPSNLEPAAVMRSTPAPNPTTALQRSSPGNAPISWWASLLRWFVQLFGGQRSTQ